MCDDPRDLDGRKLQLALVTLGRNAALRKELIDWLKTAETRLSHIGSVRDDVTGPIIDALHTEEDCYEKTLHDGTQYEFLYRTKIARDFLLATKDLPTHVWEPQTTKMLRYLATKTTLDVLVGGAYFGDHAIQLAKQIAETRRRVHCFEPNSAQFRMLNRNAELNQLNNVVLNQSGLWNTSSERLVLSGFDSFARAVKTDDSETGFTTHSIDDYCKEHKTALGLIMLDIEGAELRSLQGAQLILRRDRPAVVFEVHRDYVDWSHGLENTSICKLLSDLGYALYAVRDVNGNLEMGSRLIEIIPVSHVHLEGPPHGFNMVAVPDQNWLSDAIFRIVSNVSPKLLKHRDPALHHPTEGYPD